MTNLTKDEILKKLKDAELKYHFYIVVDQWYNPDAEQDKKKAKAEYDYWEMEYRKVNPEYNRRWLINHGYTEEEF